jgi:hypothetical protein
VTRTFLVNVPVVPVLLMLDRYPDARGRYWCPFHDDEHPGGKPSAEVGSDPCLFECWSCGAIATAAELVSVIIDCTLEEGLRRAVEIAGTNDGGLERKRRSRAAEPVRLEAELARQTQGVRYPHGVDPVARFVADRGWSADIASYVQTQWGWAGDYRGRLVMPCRDADGVLHGIRWRLPPSWEKSSRPRSRFASLYGSWRLDGQREVWICEGETDTVWAAWHLEPFNVGVLGMPGGRYIPRDRDVQLLSGRVVVIVTDNDVVGEEARERWHRSLGDCEVIDLVLTGTDLCETSESPEELRALYA